LINTRIAVYIGVRFNKEVEYMSDTLPDCHKCNNSRKIQAGYMTRDCVCMKAKTVLIKPPVEVVSATTTEIKLAPPPIVEVAPTPEAIPTPTVDLENKPTEPVVEKKNEEITPRKKASPRKREVAFNLGRQMGYTDRVIEAMLCEKEMDMSTWEKIYADIYVHPLATQLPPGYDPTKWLPGEKTRVAFRDSLVQYLPNKERKVKFDDLCDNAGLIQNG
jgi:hypothetical protein